MEQNKCPYCNKKRKIIIYLGNVCHKIKTKSEPQICLGFLYKALKQTNLVVK